MSELTRAERDTIYYGNVAHAREHARARIVEMLARYPPPAEIPEDHLGSLFLETTVVDDAGARKWTETHADNSELIERSCYNIAVLQARAGGEFFAEYDDEVEAFASVVIGGDERARCRALLEACLVAAIENPPAGWAAKTATGVERSCYNSCILACRRNSCAPHWGPGAFRSYYVERVGAVAENLDPRSKIGSRYLAAALRDGTVEVADVGFMNSYELHPEASRELRDDLNRRSQMRVVVRTSRLYRCPRCGVRECTHRETQERAADEASTTRLECIACRHQWKM